jgi:hypothetical protein
MRNRVLAFVVIAAGAVAVAIAAVVWAAAGGGSDIEQAERSAAGAPRVRVDNLAKPLVVFQHVVRDDDYAHIAVIPASGAPARRTMTGLVCERVHFAAGRGLCLMPKRGLGIKYRAMVISSDFRVRHELTLGGLLSRARVSPDGRYGATTSFIAGHSYAERGAFSTQTTLIRLADGKALANLEDFQTTRDGKRFEAIDHNYWGATFARDSNRFYATLETRGKTYLVEGDVAARSLRVLHEAVALAGRDAGCVQEACRPWLVAPARARPEDDAGDPARGGALDRRPGRVARRPAHPLRHARRGRLGRPRRRQGQPSDVPHGRALSRCRAQLSGSSYPLTAAASTGPRPSKLATFVHVPPGVTAAASFRLP